LFDVVPLRQLPPGPSVVTAADVRRLVAGG
jgi:hypothetical protein